MNFVATIIKSIADYRLPITNIYYLISTYFQNILQVSFIALCSFKFSLTDCSMVLWLLAGVYHFICLYALYIVTRPIHTPVLGFYFNAGLIGLQSTGRD
jgi:hypothetical protein